MPRLGIEPDGRCGQASHRRYHSQCRQWSRQLDLTNGMRERHGMPPTLEHNPPPMTFGSIVDVVAHSAFVRSMCCCSSSSPTRREPCATCPRETRRWLLPPRDRRATTERWKTCLVMCRRSCSHPFRHRPNRISHDPAARSPQWRLSRRSPTIPPSLFPSRPLGLWTRRVSSGSFRWGYLPMAPTRIGGSGLGDSPDETGRQGGRT